MADAGAAVSGMLAGPAGFLGPLECWRVNDNIGVRGVMVAMVAAGIWMGAGGQALGGQAVNGGARGFEARVAGLAAAAAPAGPVEAGFIQFPALNPDGTLIVFHWLNDLWIVPSGMGGGSGDDGGTATRLTSHPASERRALFAPDGTMLAFESDRDGARNLYVMGVQRDATGAVRTTEVRRVTISDRAQSLSGWGADGKSLLYTEAATGVFRGTKMRRAPVDGGPSVELTGAFGSAARERADGGAVVFTRRRAEFTRPRYVGSATSDLWIMDKGGAFTRMTDNPASDADGYWMPDGSVVFSSSRDGMFNLYRAREPWGEVTQLTRLAPKEGELTIGHGVRDLQVASSGKAAVFVVWDKLMTLDLTAGGAQPVAVSVRAAADLTEVEQQRLSAGREVSEVALSPDGKTVAQIARGEVFVRSVEENWPTRRVTNTAGRERGLAWSPDGRVLWFTTDEAAVGGGVGPSRLSYALVTLTREDIDPKPAEAKEEEKKDEKKDGEGKAEEKKDDEAKAAEVKAAEAGEPVEAGKDGAKADGAKPDAAKPAKKPREKKIDYGKRWAEALRFEVKGFDVAGLPVGKNDGVLGVEIRGPLASPDGRQLIVTRGLGDLVVIDLSARSARVLMEGWSGADVQWASDSRHVVFANEDLDFNSDVFLLDTRAGEGGKVSEAVNLTRHPDLDDSPRLSADGKVLYFRSERSGENFDFGVYVLMLDSKLESMRGYELEDYFKKAATAAKARKPIDAVLWDDAGWVEKDAAARAKAKEGGKLAEKALTFDVKDAYLRVRRLGVGSASVSNLEATPGGERVIFSQGSEAPAAAVTPAAGGAAPGAETSLVSVSYKGDDRKSITTGGVFGVGVSLGGEKVVMVRSSGAASARSASAAIAPVLGGKVDALAIDAPLVIDVAAQQRQKFMEAARVLGNGFYHPTLKGLDWKGLSGRYLSLAGRTRTVNEFDRVVSMLFGELDGSHLGINGPDAFTPPSLSAGYLGVDGAVTGEGFRVERVVAFSPAARPPLSLRVGDVITHIDEQSTAGIELSTLLVGRAGRETLVTIKRAEVKGEVKADAPAEVKADDKPESKADPKAGGGQRVLVVPVSGAEDGDLRYRDEVLRRREVVEGLSGGRLGYLHIRGMSEPSVRDFERDLFAAAHGKAGLVIDVRDNGGGSTADILLSSLTSPRHAKTQPRGVEPKDVPADAYPRDRRLIYGYSRPVVVLINENSFSNAEIFAHAIRTIGRGKLIGTATYGGVISTGAATLIDGTTVRTPFRGWYLPDGTDMENNGARPHVDVPQMPGDEASGVDAQLKAAVSELLSEVGGGK